MYHSKDADKGPAGFHVVVDNKAIYEDGRGEKGRKSAGEIEDLCRRPPCFVDLTT